MAGGAAQASAPPPAMPPAARGIPGPTAQDMAAAATLSPGEQRQMADGMVSRLEARLKDSPADPDGWIMLMRSRMSLGEGDKARQALSDAIAANPGRADMLREQAAMLGVK
jgi:cytochrome c-type biogenesis protein CcmH